jgi:hypothetical protein
MRLFLAGLLLFAGFGCTGLQPIGPLAPKRPVSNKAKAPENDPDDPVTIPAPKPVPPAILIQPEDVNADNARDAAQKLAEEFDRDRESMPSVPRTAEISRIHGGVRDE